MLVYENVVQYKNGVLIREFDTDTKETFFKKENVIPELFIDDQNGEYKSFINQKKLDKIEFDDIKDYRDTIKIYKSANRELYGRKNTAFEYIYNNYPNPKESIHETRTWFLDIEVTGEIDNNFDPKLAWRPNYAKQEITLIQFFDNFDNTYYILGLKDLEKELEVEDNTKKIKYIKFSNEKNLLLGFIRLMEIKKPAIISGWNTFFYDFPYINNRVIRVLDQYDGDFFDDDGDFISGLLKGTYVKSLSPFRIVSADYEIIHDKKEFKPDWKGIILEDYMCLYKKYTFVELPSFSLDSVCSFELGSNKVTHDEFLSFAEFYQKDFQKFVEYGLKDVELLVMLDNKMKLIQLAQFIAYTCGVCVQNVRGTLAQWQNYMYNEARKRNTILSLENTFKQDDNIKWIGGFVHSTQTDWNWVVSCDFSSLYPSIISTMNISADTWVEPNEELKALKEKYFLTYYKDDDTETVQNKNINFVKNVMFNKEAREEIHSVLEKYNVTASPNGQFFTRERKSLLAELIEGIRVDRSKNKKLMKETERKIEEYKKEGKDYSELSQQRDYYDLMQMTFKILINSCYGTLGMEFNTFAGHADYFSNAITSSGQCADISCALVAGDLIEKINQKLNEFEKYNHKNNLRFISGMDTDSYYLCIEPFVKLKCQDLSRDEIIEKCDQFVKSILMPKMRDHLDNTYGYLFNSYMPEIMELDREIIADRFISVANKMYYTRIWDNEGVRLTKPKIKIQGLAVKKVNTPNFFKDKVKEAMVLLLDKDIDGVKNLREGFYNEIQNADVKDLMISVNINSIDYQRDESGKLYSYKNGKKTPCPINSRAAIVYNDYIEKNNIPLQKLEEGKANYIFLKEPNPCRSNVIAFKDPKLFEITNLKEYIDYNLLFEKFYDGLLEIITNSLGWNISNNTEISDEW